MDHGSLLALPYPGAHFGEPKGRTAHAALAALAREAAGRVLATLAPLGLLHPMCNMHDTVRRR